MGDDNSLDTVWHDAHRADGRLLVVCHGYAEHPGAALFLGSMLDPERRFRVCAPVSPIEVDEHKRTFYRIDFAARQPEARSFAAAVDAIDATLDSACDEAGVDRADAVLAGFSQGAGLAMVVALRRSARPRPAAVIGFSAHRYAAALVDWDFEGAAGVPCWFAHGRSDRLFPPDPTRALVDEARVAGVAAEWHEHPGGHLVAPLLVPAATEFLYAR